MTGSGRVLRIRLRLLWGSVAVAILVAGLPSLVGVAEADPPPSYSDVVMSDGPVSYLRLDETSTSTSLFDTAAEALASISFPEGALGLPGALPDGEGYAASGSVSWSLPSAVDGQARAVEFWLAPDLAVRSSHQSEELISIGGLFSGSLYLSLGALRLDGSSNLETPISPAVWLGGWHHVVITTDGSLLSLYVDGLAVGDPVGVPSGQLVTATSVSVNTMGRAIDEFAVYDSELASSRIAAHFAVTGYGAPNPATGLSASPGANSVEVGWMASVGSLQPAEAVIGYRVAVSRGGARVMSRWVDPAGTSTTFTGLEPGTYSVTVSAVNAFGETTSDLSGVVVTGEVGQYAEAVHSSGPVSWWRLGESA